jgi:hypothetical protein
MNRLNAIPILVALALPAAAPMCGAAIAADYWQCIGGAWAAVGHPDHPAPTRACGSRPTLPRDQAGCEAAGGRWGPAGLFPAPICRMPTHDGGRLCGDNDECEGRCLAALTPAQTEQLRAHQPVSALGTCTPVVPVFGCQAAVDKGLVRHIICMD